MSAVLLARDGLGADADATHLPCLSDLIQSIGREGFVRAMRDYLRGCAAAEYCALYLMEQGELVEVACAGLADSAATRSDRTSYEVKRQLRQVGPSTGARLEVHEVPGADGPAGATAYRCVTICAHDGGAAHCLRVLCPAKPAGRPARGADDLREIADLLMSLVARHIDLYVRRPDLTPALSSLDEIEACLSAATELSRREREVCARILYGLSSCGIALDLGIGKESVMTYRKRAYQRLEIGSRRELLMWYLAQWSGGYAGHAAEARAAPS